MVDWLYKVKQDRANIVDCMNYYDQEYNEAKPDIILKGNIVDQSAMLSGQYEFRYRQYQETEAILEYLNIKLNIERARAYKELLETYQRALTPKDLSHYIELDEEVILMNILNNDMALVRNKFLSLTKGFETKSYQLNNIIGMRKAGLDDATV